MKRSSVAVLVLAAVVALQPCGQKPVLAGKYNPVLSIGETAPEWMALPGVDGKPTGAADLSKKSVLVLCFTCNTCPYAVDYEARLAALHRKYGANEKDVAIVAINSNAVAGDSLEAMQARATSR
ncbi:MAG: redoxin domain-containing protein, partial [Planctomycetaceae bacterium]|nr:redoxin domain-containing protein [Planctomycetaceae bacterium]